MNLTPIRAWYVSPTNPENGHWRLYYRNPDLAEKYRQNVDKHYPCSLREAVLGLHEDENGVVYTINIFHEGFQDEEALRREAMISQLKEKLTEDELKFLGIR